MTWLDPVRYYAAVDAETDALIAMIDGTDPATPVPTCPGWDLDTLTRHLGRAHRMGTAIIERRVTERTALGDIADFQPPRQWSSRPGWLRAGTRRLVAAVRDAGLDTPVWTFTERGTVDFWLRRLVHETVVHRADAAIATSRPFTVEPELGADTISEQLDLLSSPRVAAARESIKRLWGDPATLHVHATDPGLDRAGEWMVTRRADGVSWRHGHGKGDVAVRGPVTDLVVVLSGRVTPAGAGVEVHGDAALLAHWLEHSSL